MRRVVLILVIATALTTVAWGAIAKPHGYIGGGRTPTGFSGRSFGSAAGTAVTSVEETTKSPRPATVSAGGGATLDDPARPGSAAVPESPALPGDPARPAAPAR